MFMASLLTITPNWKQPRCLSTGEWINELVYTFCGRLGILLSNNKEHTIDSRKKKTNKTKGQKNKNHGWISNAFC